jgi:hypothetical protein
MLAVLAIGVGGAATTLTKRKGETSCRRRWSCVAALVDFIAQVYAFFYTRTPPCCAEVGGGQKPSYALAQNRNYVKLLGKSFNINDLQAARAVAEPCMTRKPQHIVCANH